MAICEKCGARTRRVVPVLVAGASDAFSDDRAIPRSALTPEQDAAIPWGQHPDDYRFKTVCKACGS